MKASFDISFDTIAGMNSDDYAQLIDDLKYYIVSITLMSADMRISMGQLPKGAIKDIKGLFNPQMVKNGDMYITVHIDNIEMSYVIDKMSHMKMLTTDEMI